MLPECGLVLVFRLLDVAVKHLDDGVLPVNVALVVLRYNLNILSERFHLQSEQWG